MKSPRPDDADFGSADGTESVWLPAWYSFGHEATASASAASTAAVARISVPGFDGLKTLVRDIYGEPR